MVDVLFKSISNLMCRSVEALRFWFGVFQRSKFTYQQDLQQKHLLQVCSLQRGSLQRGSLQGHLQQTRLKHPESNRLLQKGSTTLISVLVLLALLGLGLISLQYTHQDLSSAGNLRQSKQAHYVSEIGLHHAITLLQNQGAYLLTQRQPNDFIVLTSTGEVRYMQRAPNGEETQRLVLNLPPFPIFDDGPASLGRVKTQVPSYQVRIDGITQGPPPPGQELSVSDLGTPQPQFCLVHFNSYGYIAPTLLPNLSQQEIGQEEWTANFERIAEHRIKAAVVLGPFLIPSCQR